MAKRIVEHCGIRTDQRILDFGCARGYLVKAMLELGYVDTFGIDVSQWVVENCDPDVKNRIRLINNGIIAIASDWIIAKDVLEHIPFVKQAINELMRVAREGVFVVVPLSSHYNSPYVVPEYEQDITHCQRYPLWAWAEMFMRPGWRVEASYRVKGIKDNYAQYEQGNGFITARRV
jgi:hypothetical protein